MKYAFMKPAQPLETEEHCIPSSPISAFTFINFILAATSIVANLVDNVNNNRNNNNNNNNNNDNSNNFNLQNNANNGNNGNTIIVPAGKRRRKRQPIEELETEAMVEAYAKMETLMSHLDLSNEKHVWVLGNLTELALLPYQNEPCKELNANNIIVKHLMENKLILNNSHDS